MLLVVLGKQACPASLLHPVSSSRKQTFVSGEPKSVNLLHARSWALRAPEVPIAHHRPTVLMARVILYISVSQGSRHACKAQESKRGVLEGSYRHLKLADLPRLSKSIAQQR
jgi:hypothetical protein